MVSLTTSSRSAIAELSRLSALLRSREAEVAAAAAAAQAAAADYERLKARLMRQEAEAAEGVEQVGRGGLVIQDRREDNLCYPIIDGKRNTVPKGQVGSRVLLLLDRWRRRQREWNRWEDKYSKCMLISLFMLARIRNRI
jgi:hypothetical protein